ncbi:MAG: ABC transporter permease, partial [Candidatus Krumholzibacteria bacterium]|nr:ABC transporter permease [Candidatus Krumholzibacteria bacterium]
NPDQVSGFAVITSLVMAALGGCWWPIEVVSKPFQILSFVFPTGWAINGLHKVISFGYGITEISSNLIVLAAFGVVFVIAASRKLRWDL